MEELLEKIKRLFYLDFNKKEKLDAEIKSYEEKLGLYDRDNTWTCVDYRYINNKGDRGNYLENLKDKVKNNWKNPDIVIAGYYSGGDPRDIFYSIVLFFRSDKFDIPEKDTTLIKRIVEKLFKERRIITFTKCDGESLENNYIPVSIGNNKKNTEYLLDSYYEVKLDRRTNNYFISDTENLNWEIEQLIKKYLCKYGQD